MTFVNPEPLALFADAIAAGEGEVLVPSLLRAFGGRRIAAICFAGWPVSVASTFRLFTT